MMRVLVIADDDTMVGQCAVERVDLLISLGDLWDSTIAKCAREVYPSPCFAVRGNHDTAAPVPDGITDLHQLTVEHQGVVFGGFEGSWKYKPRGHHLFTQSEVAEALMDFPRVDVFVAHNSPAGIHERDDDTHQGFGAFLRYIETHQPKYFLHGHQHVNQFTTIGGTEVIGVFGERVLELSF